MTVSLANTWMNVGIGMLGSTYVLFLVSKGNFKRCRHELQARGIAALPFCFWRFRWHTIFLGLAFGASLALVVGIHRLFAGIESSESGLTLDYPWPRSNVYLNWKEVTESKVETHHFRRGYKFRLRVEAPSAVYISPWTDKKEVQSAHDLIQAHLRKPETSLP